MYYRYSGMLRSKSGGPTPLTNMWDVSPRPPPPRDLRPCIRGVDNFLKLEELLTFQTHISPTMVGEVSEFFKYATS